MGLGSAPPGPHYGPLPGGRLSVEVARPQGGAALGALSLSALTLLPVHSPRARSTRARGGRALWAGLALTLPVSSAGPVARDHTLCFQWT